MINFINTILLACLIVASGPQFLLGEEALKDGTVTKYVQEYCGYSIKLPKAWKQIADEKDTDVTDWTFTSGLYTYLPSPGSQPGLTMWLCPETPECALGIMMFNTTSGYSAKRCQEEFMFEFLNSGHESIDKGQTSLQNEKCYWRVWNLPKQYQFYQLCFGHKGKMYCAFFCAQEISPEIRQKFDEILKSFTFLN